MTALLGLNLMDTAIIETTMASKSHTIPLASISSLKLVVPLLNPQFLPPTVAYTLIKAREKSIHLTTTVGLDEIGP